MLQIHVLRQSRIGYGLLRADTHRIVAKSLVESCPCAGVKWQLDEISSTQEAPAGPQARMAQPWPMFQAHLLGVALDLCCLFHLIHDCILFTWRNIYRPREQAFNKISPQTWPLP